MTDHDEATRAAERKANPPVGPRGELAGREPTDLPEWTLAELEHATEAMRATWQVELEHAVYTARYGQLGLPSTLGPGYFAARAYLLECLLHPVRIIIGLPDEQVEVEQLTPGGQLWQVPEREDTAQRELDALTGRIRQLQRELRSGDALSSWTALQRQAVVLQLHALLQPRCHVCDQHQPPAHVPGSPDCQEALAEKRRSVSDD